MSDPGSPPRSASPILRAFAAILLAAAVVHVVVWLDYADDPFSTTHVSDALSYDRWAERIALEGVAAEPVFHQAPLYPMLLAAIYRFAPEPARANTATGIQALLSALAIACLVPLGRRWFGSRSHGVAAALLALCHGPIVFYSLKLLPLSLALATQAAGLLALTRARDDGRMRWAVVAGAAWGLACLARAEMLLFAPIALFALFPRTGGRSPRPARAAVAYALGLVVVLAPATAHNLRRGDFVVVSSSSGENLYIGNQRGANGGYTALHPSAGDIFSQRLAAERLAQEAEGRTLRPSQVSAHWRHRALDEIAADPAAWIALEAKKLGRLLHPGDPSDIYSFLLERASYLPSLHLLAITPWTLLLLAPIGLALSSGAAGRPAWPLAALIGVHAAVLLAFFVDTRLRLPLLFFLCPFAGYAIVEGVRRWRAGRRKLPWLVAATTGIALLSGLTLQAGSRDLLRLASTLSREGRLAESLELLAPELERADPDPRLADQAGWVLQRMGRFEDARARYLQSLEAGADPRREHQTRTRLAMVLEQLGRYDEAGTQHDRAVADSHADAGTFYQRGMFRRRRGDRSGAVGDLREASRRDAAWPAPREALREIEAQ